MTFIFVLISVTLFWALELQTLTCNMKQLNHHLKYLLDKQKSRGSVLTSDHLVCIYSFSFEIEFQETTANMLCIYTNSMWLINIAMPSLAKRPFS